MLRRLYSWYGKTVVHACIAFVVALLCVGAYFALHTPALKTDVSTSNARTVRTATIASLIGGGSVSIIGTVEAVSEAAVESETSGRVTSVPVELGSQVRVGTILAQLENASERAAVLQAQGSYEAALAAAAQSNTSLASAEVSLKASYNEGLNTYRTSFATTEGIVRNTLDTVFSDPTGVNPGFRLDALGAAPELNQIRKDIEALLITWSQSVASNPDADESPELLLEAERTIQRIINFTQRISTIASVKQNDGKTVGGTSIDTIRLNFTTARNTLEESLQNIRSARTAIDTAINSLENAEIGGTGRNISAAEAQVKQALGALRAVEANLSKTIIRSPISGTVNALDVKVGDFVGQRTVVARVANNTALELTTFINDNERDRVAEGDEVLIGDVYMGVITHIAPAIDPLTKKIEVRIGTDATELTNGETVRISLKDTETDTTVSGDITIPISALKVETDRIVVFSVTPENTLVAHEVIEGPIVGDAIIIREGLTSEMSIVLDARGLNEGDTVLLGS